MSAKLIYSLTDENPDLQKQIGCMNGFFQLFDRNRYLAGGRVNSHGHKRLPPPGTYIYIIWTYNYYWYIKFLNNIVSSMWLTKFFFSFIVFFFVMSRIYNGILELYVVLVICLITPTPRYRK